MNVLGLSNAESLRQTYLEPSKLRTIRFDVNLDGLEEGYKRALPKLFRACEAINEPFLIQDHPQSLKIRKKLLKRAKVGDEDAKVALEVFNIFNGPIGVTEEDKPAPLFQGVKPRPKGGTLYTEGITAEEIETYLKKHPEKRAEFERINTVIRRKGKGLTAVPYEKKYRKQLKEAAEQFVKKWAAWSDEAQYASKVMKECKLKFYNKVEQPTAEALLGGEA